MQHMNDITIWDLKTKSKIVRYNNSHAPRRGETIIVGERETPGIVLDVVEITSFPDNGCDVTTVHVYVDF